MKKKKIILIFIFIFMTIFTGCGEFFENELDNTIPAIPLEPSNPNKPDNNTIPALPLEPSNPNKPDNDTIPSLPLEPSNPITPPELGHIRDLFYEGFGSDVNMIYFAIHVTGKSSKGKFLQIPSGNLGQGDGVGYARDLKIIYNGKSETQTITFPFSSMYSELGLSDIYSVEHGFADKLGNNLDMRFYLGHPDFKVPRSANKIAFTSFAIVDLTKPIWGGFADMVFVRCGVSDGIELLQFPFPANEYNPAIHKNIAKFTIEFNDNLCHENGYTVIFDGFVKK